MDLCEGKGAIGLSLLVAAVAKQEQGRHVFNPKSEMAPFAGPFHHFGRCDGR